MTIAKRQPETVIRRPTRQEIAARAYQIWLERGRTHGHDVDDWLQAEYELMRAPLRVLAKMQPSSSSPKSVINVVQNALAVVSRPARRKKSESSGPATPPS